MMFRSRVNVNCEDRFAILQVLKCDCGVGNFMLVGQRNPASSPSRYLDFLKPGFLLRETI